jgi:hypothetical protein
MLSMAIGPEEVLVFEGDLHKLVDPFAMEPPPLVAMQDFVGDIETYEYFDASLMIDLNTVPNGG